MCVNLSFKDKHWEPPPLRTILISLSISEASKPTSYILQSAKYLSLSSDSESVATARLKFNSLLQQLPL